MSVPPKEIIEALRHVGCSSGLDVRHALANRIEAEGIAPPDGYELVPINDEAAAPKGVGHE